MSSANADMHAQVSMRDGGLYIIAFSEYHRLRADWQSGKAFCDVVGFYGEEFSIKLAEVNGLARLSDSALRAIAASGDPKDWERS